MWNERDANSKKLTLPKVMKEQMMGKISYSALRRRTAEWNTYHADCVRGLFVSMFGNKLDKHRKWACYT